LQISSQILHCNFTVDIFYIASVSPHSC
jgi:hypothetical protein